MKLVLHIVVVLMAATDLIQGTSATQMHPWSKCMGNCGMAGMSDEGFFYPEKRVCAESGKTFQNRCIFNCEKDLPDAKPGDLKEVDCKPGSFEHFWNTECTDDERRWILRVNRLEDVLCQKDPPHYLSRVPCKDKWDEKDKSQRIIEFAPCSEYHKKD